jgi:hypothetical protein
VVSRSKLASRVVLFVVAGAVAGWRFAMLAVDSVSDHSPYAAFLLAPLVAVLVALWRQSVVGDELDVHDRHVDFTVAIVAGGMALALSSLLSRRLGNLAPAIGLEIVALPLWAAAAAVALFGTRPTRRHLYSLFLLGLVWPLPFNALGALVPARSFGWFVAATIVTIACGGILVGPGRRVAVVVAVGVAAVIVAAQRVANPALVIVGVAAVLATARVARIRVLPRPRPRALFARGPSKPAVHRARRAIPVVACFAIAAAATPSMTPTVIPYPEGANVAAEMAAINACPRLGRGWVLIDRVRIGDPERLGAFPTTRCRYRDASDQPSGSAAIDLSDPAHIDQLAATPFEVAYRTDGAESPVEYPVALPHGDGTLLAFDSPSRPLTTVVLTGLISEPTLPDGDARRFAVIVTDDPLSDSPMPVLAPHVVGASILRLSEIVRTSPEQARLTATDPKNAAIARQLAGIVVSQWEGG